MAAELKSDKGIDAQLIEGGRGVFDVKVDGALVFSKHSVGRFPNDGEITALLSAE